MSATKFHTHTLQIAIALQNSKFFPVVGLCVLHDSRINTDYLSVQA
jgi:hypothetical protein